METYDKVKRRFVKIPRGTAGFNCTSYLSQADDNERPVKLIENFLPIFLTDNNARVIEHLQAM